MGTCKDGIAFGKYENGIGIVKTFISREMQFDKQKKLNNYIDKLREEVWKQIA